MKLTIAATAILMAMEGTADSSSMASSLSSRRAAWKVTRDNHLLPSRRSLSQQQQQHYDLVGRPIQQRRRRWRQLQSTTKTTSSSRQQQLRNLSQRVPSISSSSQHQSPVRECHYSPQQQQQSQSAAAAAADVGILSCGLFQYCKESSESKLGGVCALNPKLEQRFKQKRKIIANNDGLDGFDRLKNSIEIFGTTPTKHQECDPIFSTTGRFSFHDEKSSTEADVGILSSSSTTWCSSHQYCQPNNESSLGGICVDVDDYQPQPQPQQQQPITDFFSNTPRILHRMDHPTSDSSSATSTTATRNLQTTTTNGNYEDFDYLANYYCTNGNFTCTTCSYGDDESPHNFDCSYVEPICSSYSDPCVQTDITDGAEVISMIDVCYNSRVIGQQDASQQTFSQCTELISPGQFGHCNSLTLSSNGNDGTETFTCQYSINGIDCNSCTVVDGGQDNDERCMIFDCENTEIPISGNTCTFDFDILRTREITEAVYPCDSGGCRVCAEGEVMRNPNTLLQLTGGPADCNSVQIAAWTGYGPFANATYCNSLTVLAAETCGCYNPEVGVYVPPESFPPVATPEAPVSAPTADDYLTLFEKIRQGGCKEDGAFHVCTKCEVDETGQTASFDCEVPEYCRNVSSFCTEPLTVCFGLSVMGSITSDDTYDYTYCSSFKTTPKDVPYEFDYCIAYNVSPDGDTCVMEVDGVVCTSCDVGTDEYGFFATYDCENTVLGRTSQESNVVDLMEETEDYFVYKALPCPGGCNLCGSDDATMTNPNATFTHNGSQQGCFQAQFAALVGPTLDTFCQEVKPSADDPCECQDPPIPSPPTAAPTPSTSESSGAATTLFSFASSKAIVMVTVGVVLTIVAHGI